MTTSTTASPTPDVASGPSTVEGDGKPTGLKSVIDVIPDHCYQRSTARGLWLIARDVAAYGLVVWGLASTDNPVLLVPLWILAGLVVSGLFVLGHDAAHDALFDSKRLNAIVARLTMLPSLHATEQWIFGHNRVHHGHTLRQGMDFVWHPSTVEEYRAKSRLGRLVHRFEWGPFGAGAYYLRHVWVGKMVTFSPPERWRRPMRRDKALVALFALATLGASIAVTGIGRFDAGLWLWAKTVVIPFLVFCQSIGWVVYVHHIAPEIRWWPRREWNRYRGQVEGTTIFEGPPGWEIFYHWIMVHLPHHVDMRIPCYRLREAAEAIARALDGEVQIERLSLRRYLRSTRNCKLYDFEQGHWLPYSAAADTAVAPATTSAS